MHLNAPETNRSSTWMLSVRFVVDSTRDININDFQFGNQLRDFCLFSNSEPDLTTKTSAKFRNLLFVLLLFCTYWCNLKTFLNRKICLHCALVGNANKSIRIVLNYLFNANVFLLKGIIVLAENWITDYCIMQPSSREFVTPGAFWKLFPKW